MYCALALSGILMAAPMVTKLQGSLGDRIRQAYRSHGWSRMDFWRKLHAIRPEILYGQVIKWEKGATPIPENLLAIAEASEYALSDFTDGYGSAHAVMSDGGGSGARDVITRLMQSGELAPFTDDDMKFMQSCVSTEPKISASKLRAGLIGYRLAMGDDVPLERFRQAVTEARSTSSFPPPPLPTKPASTLPRRPRRPGKR